MDLPLEKVSKITSASLTSTGTSWLADNVWAEYDVVRSVFLFVLTLFELMIKIEQFAESKYI